MFKARVRVFRWENSRWVFKQEIRSGINETGGIVKGSVLGGVDGTTELPKDDVPVGEPYPRAIRDLKYVASCSDETNISVGACCSGYIDLEIWIADAKNEKLRIQADDKIELYVNEFDEKTQDWDHSESDATVSWTCIGAFYAEKPTKSSANCYRLTAYDAISKLDVSADQFLEDNYDPEKSVPTVKAVENKTTGEVTYEYTYGNGCYYSYSDLLTGLKKYCNPNDKYFETSNLIRVDADPVVDGVMMSTAFTNLVTSKKFQKFKGTGITWRKILQWLAQACGAFATAYYTREGKTSTTLTAGRNSIHFEWYTDRREDFTIGPDTDANAVLVQAEDEGQDVLATNDLRMFKQGYNATMAFMQDGLTYEDYSVDLIDGFRINQTDADAGCIYPEQRADKSFVFGNVYMLTGNQFLMPDVNDSTHNVKNYLMPIATRLFHQMGSISYVPCKVDVQAGFKIRPGFIISVIDVDNTRFDSYVTSVTVSLNGTAIESTGDKNRNSQNQYASKYSISNQNGSTYGMTLTAEGMNREGTAYETFRAEKDKDVDTSLKSALTAIGANASAITAVKSYTSSVSESAKGIIEKFGAKTTVTTLGDGSKVYGIDETAEFSRSASNFTSSLTRDILGEDDKDASGKPFKKTAKSIIDQTVDEISLSVENGTDSSKISLNRNGVTIGSTKTIKFSGVVTFASLQSNGTTTIDGSRITAGVIQSVDKSKDYEDARNKAKLDMDRAKDYLDYLISEQSQGTKNIVYGSGTSIVYNEPYRLKPYCNTSNKIYSTKVPITTALDTQITWYTKLKNAYKEATEIATGFEPMKIDLDNARIITYANRVGTSRMRTELSGSEFKIVLETVEQDSKTKKYVVKEKRPVLKIGRTGTTDSSDDNDGLILIGGNIDNSDSARIELSGTQGKITLKEKDGQGGKLKCERLECNTAADLNCDDGLTIYGRKVKWKEYAIGGSTHYFLVDD